MRESALKLENKRKEQLLKEIKGLYQKKFPKNDTIPFTDKYSRGIRIIVETDKNCPFPYGVVWRIGSSTIYLKEPPWDREFKTSLDSLSVESLEKILQGLHDIPRVNGKSKLHPIQK